MKKYILFFASLFVSLSICAAERTVKGTVKSEGKGIAQVVVTDGVRFATTDAKGRYSITVNDESRYVYISTPAGYQTESRHSVPVFWQTLSEDRKVYDFELTRKEKADEHHGFVVTADPQVWARKEFKLLSQAVDDIRETVAQYEIPFHGICCGDVTSYDHSFYETYNEITEKSGLVFYSVIGNHDMTLYGRSFETSTRLWEDVFGPAYYSYNVGKAHYVVLDNNFYIGRDYFYIGYLDEKQLKWLEKDLSYVDKDAPLFIAFHIPSTLDESDRNRFSYSNISSIMTNSANLYKILEPFNAHILSGHIHTSANQIISERLFEHNIPALCGAWWQGVLCTDGTPRGYGVFEVNGREVNWYYKSSDYPADYQMALYTENDEPLYKGYIVANVWAYDPTWKITVAFDGGEEMAMEQFSSYDPAAKKMYSSPEKLDHSYVHPTKNTHFFRAALPQNAGKVVVTVIDGFGRKYTQTQNLK